MSETFIELLLAINIAALINIIIIDIVMSGDNAIIIGMATKDLDPKYRKRAIIIWIAVATILRIIFSIFVVYLLQIVGLKLAGWLLLLYVVWTFYKWLRNNESEWHNVKTALTFSAAIWTIILADVSMSLDNVLAVAWAAHDNVVLLWIGLVISILLMAFASNFIAEKLWKYPQIQWVWLVIILFVAIEMILSGSQTIPFFQEIPNYLPSLMWIIAIFLMIAHAKYISVHNEENIKKWLWEKYPYIFMGIIWLWFLFLFFWDLIFNKIHSSKELFYGLLLIFIGLLTEWILLFRKKK